MAPMLDLIIIGAGPIGIETAIRAKRAGLGYLLLDKGCVVSAIAHYPTYMTFFTTSERLEVGGHPLVTATDKPTRKEALEYYRKVVANEGLELRQYHAVTNLKRLPQGFEVSGCDDKGAPFAFRSRLVAVATGYFDTPKLLGVPGEALPNVSHYYSEAHPFYRRRVTIVGAGSSAADAALDLYRAGAQVTIVHRGEDFRHSLKYWVRPNLENRVKEGAIVAHFSAVVREITPEALIIDKAGERLVIPTDQTFALTGYYASPALLERAGVKIDPDTLAAAHDPETFETNVPGLYVLGSAGYGARTSDVFIENGLVHVAQALPHMLAALEPHPQAVTG